ncbi:hypothetical protein HMI54_009178 [Coelomomyces lativittatus]|nr:hypothetical protein HMI55_001218 [Coelomomyces lativittatus]KAJ1516511.1 hypothetical protein HMI54_009178 [Coelomomyces lativittatus]
MYLSSEYFSTTKPRLSPHVLPLKRIRARPVSSSSSFTSPCFNSTLSSTPFLIYVKGTPQSYQHKKEKPELHIHYPKLRRTLESSKKSENLETNPSSTLVTQINVSNVPSNLKKNSPSSAAIKSKKRSSSVSKSQLSSSNHVIVEKPVDIMKELSDKLKFFTLKTSTKKTKYLLNFNQIKNNKKLESKRKKTEEQKIDILNKTHIIMELKLRYEKLLALQKELKQQHKTHFLRLNKNMTDSLHEVEEFDLTLSGILEIQKSEREEAKKSALDFEIIHSKILAVKKENLQQHINDLQEISRIIQELRLLKANLATSSEYLKHSLVPIEDSRKEVELCFSKEKQVLMDKMKSIRPVEIEKIYSKMKQYIDMKSNKLLHSFFMNFTVPLYHTQLKLKHDLNTQKKLQERTLTLISDLKKKMKKENLGFIN